jgi:hypothetical protein
MLRAPKARVNFIGWLIGVRSDLPVITGATATASSFRA